MIGVYFFMAKSCHYRLVFGVPNYTERNFKAQEFLSSKFSIFSPCTQDSSSVLYNFLLLMFVFNFRKFSNQHIFLLLFVDSRFVWEWATISSKATSFAFEANDMVCLFYFSQVVDCVVWCCCWKVAIKLNINGNFLIFFYIFFSISSLNAVWRK